MHRTELHRGRGGALAPAAVLLLALCLLAGGAQALNGFTTTSPPAGYETPIVTVSGDQVDPVVFGTRVVWQDWRSGQGDSHRGDIYSYDTATHLELPEGVSTSDYGKILADDYDPAVSARGVFWVYAGRSDADVNNRILGRTLAGDPINVSVEQGGSYWVISDLDADGDALVGVIYNGYSYRLLHYWWFEGHDGYNYYRQTTNEIRSPKISGNTIVWQEFDGNDWNVFATNLSQSQTIALANNPASDEVSPTVSGTRVVWADNRSGDWDLYTADLSQPDPVGAPWLVAPGDQEAPSLDGDRLAWQDDRDGDRDVWLGSLSGGTGAAIADAAGDQQAPEVHGDRIVWQDRRNGDWDVYQFTVSATGPAPVPTPRSLVITAPGTYAVGADGWDGATTPVEVRASDVVLDGGNRTLDGAGRAGTCGVLVSGPVSNVVVRNLRLTNWEIGVSVEDAADARVEGCEVEHNRFGVALNGTRRVTVSENRIRANDDVGVAIHRSTNASVVGNDVSRTGDGFQHFLYTTMDLGTFAVAVGGSDGTAIVDNDLGGRYGSLSIGGSTATRVTGNQLTGRSVGIHSLWQSDGAEVYDNVFRNFDHVYGAPENTTWNATPSPGPNVVGGPVIGGNFWARPDGTGFSETQPDLNRDGFVDVPFENEEYGGGTDYLPLAAWNGPAPGPTPYRPLSVPGRIEAEYYDLGGFSDTTPGNAGGALRQDDVDIETVGGVTNVGWIRNGEWLTYTATVESAGTYTMTARVASPNAGRTIAVAVDGTPAATIAVPRTGSFTAWQTVSVPVTIPAGTHTIRLTFSGDGQNLDWLEFEAPTPTPSPYGYVAIPATIEAENYDLGGEGVGYHDTTPGNSGGAYRSDGVDVAAIPSGHAVVGIEDGEWLVYTIGGVSPTPQLPALVLYLGSDRDGGSVQVEVNGRAAGNVSVPNTGSPTAFRAVQTQVVAATGTLRLLFHGGGIGLDRIESPVLVAMADGYATPNFTVDRTNGTAPLTVRFTDTSSEWAYEWRWDFGDGTGSTEQNPVHVFQRPGVFNVSLTIKESDRWNGGAYLHIWNDPSHKKFAQVTVEGAGPVSGHAIPGTIQAEAYDAGGEGVGYHDTTPGNAGGAYRSDGVDIETAGGVTNVGWIRAGEWLAYTATVQPAGQYTLTARVASPNSGRTIAVAVDGAPAGTIAVPNTGSFSTWRTVQIPVQLPAGTHTVRLTFAGDGQNLDWIAFGTGPIITTPTTPVPSGGASFTAAPLSAPKGSAVRFTVTPASGKTIKAAWWSFDAAAHLNTWNSRATNPTFYYPAKGTFSPLVKLTYADGSTETVQRTGYVMAT